MAFTHTISDADVSVTINELGSGFDVTLSKDGEVLGAGVAWSKSEAFRTAFQFLLDEFDDLEPFKVTLT